MNSVSDSPRPRGLAAGCPPWESTMGDPEVGSRSEGGSWRGGQLVGRSGSRRFSGSCWSRGVGEGAVKGM